MEKKTSIIRAVVDLGYNTDIEREDFLLTLFTPTLYEKLILTKELNNLEYLNITQYDKVYDLDVIINDSSILGCLKNKCRLLSNKNQNDINKVLDKYFNKGHHLYYFIDVFCPKDLKSLFAKDLKNLFNTLGMTLVNRSVNDIIVEDYLDLFNRSYKTVRMP